MAERRKARSGSGSGGRTSTRSREPSGRDERELLEAEPGALEEDELFDADELGEADEDEMLDADEPEVADQDEMLDADEPGEADEEMLDADEPEVADQDGSPAGGQRRPARRGRKAMTAGEAAKAALREIVALTAKQPEGVTGVERTEDGWTVGIELVEDQRIPSSSDILAIYETTIDADGELLSYRRVRRYARGRGDTEES
jgi:Gas vesicle synthesis protein GvpO